MCRKIVFVACVVVLSMAMKVSATSWVNTSGDGKWGTAANWSLGAVPVMVPDATGMAQIDLSGVNACVIDGTQPQAVCQWLFVADAYASGTLNIVSGGKIGNPIWGPGETHIANTASEASIGVINVDGAGSIAQSECWRIGSTEKSSGTLNITNGGYVVAGMWPQSMHIFTTGRVNIISGSMYISGGAPDTGGLPSALTIDNGGVMNISGTSTLTLRGDQLSLANGFIASGAIRGGGVIGDVAATLDGTNTMVVYRKASQQLMSLRRGITFDRQFHQIPVEWYCEVNPGEVQLVKQMGFDFAKVLVNPALMISGSTINTANIGYVDELVNKFVSQGVPVVVCLHPENDFKYNYLGNAANFAQLLGFYHDFAAYLAARWGRGQVAFELMTEPFGNYTSWNTMLQQMWNAARSGMPDNILILDADNTAAIDNLILLNPVADDNVYYSFTTYAPLVFTFQGAYWYPAGNYQRALQRVPYPSSPAIIAAEKPRILNFLASNGYGTSAADAALTTYGNETWNKSKQLAMLAPITAWNNAHGGNLKVFCAEYGVFDANQSKKIMGIDTGCVPADRIQFIKDRREALEESNISWSYWSFNETFTVFDPAVRTPSAGTPTTSWFDNPTLGALGLPLCGCGCKVQPSSPYDLNKDCHVNILDIAMFASTWLKCTEPADPRCL